jgi:hypothetical protein
MQNAGLAVLGILIPLSIAILQEIIHRENKDNEGFLKLDINVILDEVFIFKNLLLYVGLMFLPLLFWTFNENDLIRFIIFSLWLFGLVKVGLIILNVYKWTKGNVWEYRSSYLDQVKSSLDTEKSWRSIWSSRVDPNLRKSDQGGFSGGDELDLLKKFSVTISNLIKEDE